jgi:hypothetical protein
MAKRARGRRSKGKRTRKERIPRPEPLARRRDRTEGAIEAFGRYLERSGEGPLRTRRHLERMEAFGLDHVAEEMGTTPMDVTPAQVGIYMGTWFPCQFRHEGVGEVGSMLDTLERWFRFLRKERLLGGDLEDYLRVLGRRRLYEERFDTFHVAMNMGGEVGSHLDEWADAWDEVAAGPAAVDSYGAAELKRLVTPPTDLGDALETHGVASLPALADLVMLVERLGERPVRLTEAKRWLPRRELMALSSARRAPERAGNRPDQGDMPVLNALVLSARAIGALAEDDHRNLGPGPARAAFLALPPERQYWGLVNAFWNLVRWKEVAGWGWGFLPDKVQRGRGVVSEWILEGRVPTSTLSSGDLMIGMTALVLGNLVAVLAALGLVEGRDKGLDARGTLLARPTPLGEEVLTRLLPGDAQPLATRGPRDGERAMVLRASVMNRPEVWREVAVLEGQTLVDLDAALRRSIPLVQVVPTALLVGDRVYGDAALLGDRVEVDDPAVPVSSLGLGPGSDLSFSFNTREPTYLDVTVLDVVDPSGEWKRFPRVLARNVPRYHHCEECDAVGRVAHLYCTDCDVMLCDDCAGDHDEDALREFLY